MRRNVTTINTIFPLIVYKRIILIAVMIGFNNLYSHGFINIATRSDEKTNLFFFPINNNAFGRFKVSKLIDSEFNKLIIFGLFQKCI